MIEINKVSVGLGDRTILADVSVRVPAGQCLALLGPSGSGKTTLLRLLAGLEKPDAGTIRINGKLVSTPQKLTAPYDRSVGMVFQELALWPHMTVWQQLDFAVGADLSNKKIRHGKIEAALSRVKLDAFKKAYPHQLSGGEKQRLALARALIQEPEILLLDEPFSGLDAELKNRLLLEIRKIAREMNMTCIFVTHLVSEAEYLVDRMLTIRNGRVRSRQMQKDEALSADHAPNRLVCHTGGRGR
ncbi:hypothetical protein DSCA_25390 [Desulfosarcina alkanivorans]|uniref:ABC transporter domain-containing protein n=1 Tax=Desulfosarcina alkanivorans TaxID=571177 RepID=A0A5K7YL42_9BACT|nr:ABC transporter ATP-binding protein [Desulfosarcina alkanivorans]BBO68609.1 hypothetical protein DSCA_25390 [Desulfosarcina alkanivorans]